MGIDSVAWTSKRTQPEATKQYGGDQKYGDTYTIKKGNTAWDVAKSGLQSKGVAATNAEIMKEINRLAAINGCKNADELKGKFKIGATIKVEGYSPEVKHHAEAKQGDPIEQITSGGVPTPPKSNIVVPYAPGKQPGAAPAPVAPKQKGTTVSPITKDGEHIVTNRNNAGDVTSTIVVGKNLTTRGITRYDAKTGKPVEILTMGTGTHKREVMCSEKIGLDGKPVSEIGYKIDEKTDKRVEEHRTSYEYKDGETVQTTKYKDNSASDIKLVTAKGGSTKTYTFDKTKNDWVEQKNPPAAPAKKSLLQRLSDAMVNMPMGIY